MSAADSEEPVFVIDLTDRALEECAGDIGAAAGRGGSAARPDRALPEPPEDPIRQVALLLEGDDDPLLLPIEPTRDVALLDALARLLRVAVVAGERVPALAIDCGGILERRLAFERRLPAWVYDGLPRRLAKRLPPRVRRVLARRDGV